MGRKQRPDENEANTQTDGFYHGFVLPSAVRFIRPMTQPFADYVNNPGGYIFSEANSDRVPAQRYPAYDE